MKYEGIGLIKGISNVCHYPKNDEDKELIYKNASRIGMPVVALENCSAIEVIDSKYRIITSSKSARAYILYLRNGKIIEENLPLD